MGGGRLVVGLFWWYQVYEQISMIVRSPITLTQALFLRWCTIIWRVGGGAKEEKSFFFHL